MSAPASMARACPHPFPFRFHRNMEQVMRDEFARMIRSGSGMNEAARAVGMSTTQALKAAFAVSLEDED